MERKIQLASHRLATGKVNVVESEIIWELVSKLKRELAQAVTSVVAKTEISALSVIIRPEHRVTNENVQCFSLSLACP